MVSSAVAGLPPGNVTLVDQGGHLLTRSEAPGRALNDTQLNYATDVESRYQRRIESILVPIVGSGNVHAQVTAQIDFASKEQTEEQYRPNGNPEQSAIRSRQLNQSNQSNGQFPGGIPGALSNQPAPANAAPITTPAQPDAQGNTQPATTTATSQNGSNNSSRDETTNYEVDKTILHTKLNTGDVQRLSVAVVINYRQLADGSPAPLSEDQLKQIESLTREAMGFSQTRGDTLNVVNSPFTATEDEALDQLPFWKSQTFFDLLLSSGRWLLVLLVVWLLWRKAIRPLITQRTEAIKLAAEVQQIARKEKEDEESAVSMHLTRDEQIQQRKVNQRLSAEIMSQRVRDLADSDPRVVALVIRQWMSNEI
jgi:flagellar M-ring protein FliF